VVTIKIRVISQQSFVTAGILINLCLCLPWTNSFRSTLFSCTTVIVSTYLVSDQLMIAQGIEHKLEPVCLPTFVEGLLGVLVIPWVL
jgi:hypothetical protein